MKTYECEFFTLDASTTQLYPFLLRSNYPAGEPLCLFKDKEVARAAITALNRSINRILRSYRLRDDHLTKQEAINNMAP